MTKDEEFIEKIKTINLGTKPPWAQSLGDLNKTIDDPDANTKIGEDSQRLKAQWTKSGKWAKWERERKAAAMKNKPEWIKRGADPKERDEAIKG